MIKKTSNPIERKEIHTLKLIRSKQINWKNLLRKSVFSRPLAPTSWTTSFPRTIFNQTLADSQEKSHEFSDRDRFFFRWRICWADVYLYVNKRPVLGGVRPVTVTWTGRVGWSMDLSNLKSHFRPKKEKRKSHCLWVNYQIHT